MQNGKEYEGECAAGRFSEKLDINLNIFNF
jgi:hypothetical protein